MRNVRATYIEAFARGLSRCRAEGRQLHPEIRFEVSGERRHELYRLVVADAVEKGADGSVSAITFETSASIGSYPGIHVVSSVAWQNMTFRCRRHGFPEAELVNWGNRWIYDEAPPLGAQDGLTGIIHSVSQPEPNHDGLEFNVDFGSAPFEAFEELCALLAGHVQALLTFSANDGET